MAGWNGAVRPAEAGDLVAVAGLTAELAQSFAFSRETGPAGGTWSAGTSGPLLSLDAVGFCRALSGRGPRDGLLTVPVPF